MTNTEAVKAVHRYEVPVDDLPHTITMSGDPYHVAALRRGLAHGVEFWAENRPDASPHHRAFRVYGTGHPIPATAKWWGTTDRMDGFVWHLYELGASADA